MQRGDRSAMIGVVLLLLATFLWGTSFPVIKILMYDVPPWTYTGVRSVFSLAVLLVLFLAELALGKPLDLDAWRGGILTGVAYAMGIMLQGWGTAFTTASNSAFLTSMSVIMVLAMEFALKKKLDARVLAAGLASVAGVYLMAGGGALVIGLGDALVLASALFWAVQIMLISYLKYSSYVQFVTAMFIPSLGFLLPSLGSAPTLDARELLWLAYLGAVVGAFSSFLQVAGQRRVSASLAAIIYQLEPVFASVLSYLFLSEVFTSRKTFGAAVILAATTYASLLRVKARPVT